MPSQAPRLSLERWSRNSRSSPDSFPQLETCVGSLQTKNCIVHFSSHCLDRFPSPNGKECIRLVPGLEHVPLNVRSDPGICALALGQAALCTSGLGGGALEHLFCWAECDKLGSSLGVRCVVLWEQTRQEGRRTRDLSVWVLWQQDPLRSSEERSHRMGVKGQEGGAKGTGRRQWKSLRRW